jgi:formylglycine-generating enzyme required for sulfatase activity
VLVDDIYGIELVYVEGGTFKRGSETGGKLERPVGNVHVSSFYISKCEVHQQLWIDIMGYNTSSHLGKSLPLHGATWYEVHEFIEKLNKKTGKKFRLPTEAEWEFAARGGVRHSDKITKYSSEADIQCNTNSPRNVNEGKCNEIGLFNMAGNVFEWCEDKYGWYEESATIIYNPIGDGELSFTKSIRGGDYSSDYSKCTVTWREGRNPNQPFGVGFRLVHDAE